jgi:hypothetical protein
MLALLDKTIFEKFISNAAEIEITETSIKVRFNEKGIFHFNNYMKSG